MSTEVATRAALATLGLGGSQLSYLSEGLSSDAWLVEKHGSALILRISNSAEHLDELTREHAVLAALIAAGAHVPAPVAGSWEHPGWSGPPFSLTTFVAGQPLGPGDVLAIADDIASFLRVLHATSPPEGTPNLAQRFQCAPIWPIHRTTLRGHPCEENPRSTARIDNAANGVRRALAGPHVLVHSDLHHGNILRTQTGAAFLDFGCAFEGVAAWDFAALAFFLGWPITERLLEITGSPSAHDVRLVALSFALYRWELCHEDHEETQHCAAFIDDMIDSWPVSPSPN